MSRRRLKERHALFVSGPVGATRGHSSSEQE
jgi:hypothetical protein